MPESVREAIRLLGVYTAGRYDLWALAGQGKASCRAHVMSALCGQKMTQAKSGVTALRSAFYAAIGIAGECEAARESNFRQFCRHAMAPCPA